MSTAKPAGRQARARGHATRGFLGAFTLVVLAGAGVLVLAAAALAPVFRFLERLEQERERQAEAEDDGDDDGDTYEGVLPVYAPSKFASLHENRAT